MHAHVLMGCVAIVVVKATGLACRTVPWVTSVGVMSCGGPGHMACWKRSPVSPVFLSLSPGTFRKGHKTVSLLRITFLKWSQTIWWIFIVEYSPMSVFLELYPHPRFPPLPFFGKPGLLFSLLTSWIFTDDLPLHSTPIFQEIMT